MLQLFALAQKVFVVFVQGAGQRGLYLALRDEQDDLAQYDDEARFRAFRAIISKPLASEADTLGAATREHADEIWKLMRASDTYVYLAGLGKIAERFDHVMRGAAGSDDAWTSTRDRLKSVGRWAELVYS